MQTFDWLIIAAYMVTTMLLGVYLSRRASGSLVDFFAGGRALPWWLAGTSMAATTFSIDTPLYVAGVVGTRGIAGNWEWWNFAIAHIILVYVFARLWRRSEVVTDAELTEIRYGGKPAATLRATKTFLFAVLINSVGIGMATLAMVKVLEALLVFDQLATIFPILGSDDGQTARLWAVVAVSGLTLIYSAMAGLWGSVVTDFFQFFLGMIGAFLVAFIVVNHVGGMGELTRQVQAVTEFDVLSFTPFVFGEGGFLGLVSMSQIAGITFSTFFAYTFVQWWAFRRSDGGGEFVQRLISSKDEAEAEKSAWFFNLMHYVVRTWPWIVVALAAIVVYPELEDYEMGYPMLMLDFLPVGVLGLVVASLIAAFMSTVSTLINWGASYLTNDMYARFINRNASETQLVFAGRMASVLVTVLGSAVAFYSEHVMDIFRLILAIGTGPGLVLILRWFWWRINAWAELAAMVAGFLVGLGTTVVPILQFSDFGIQLMVITAITAAIWIPVMFLTPPESDEKLDAFYTLVRPGGAGWNRVRERTGIPAAQSLVHDLLRVPAGLMFLFGTMFAIGGFLLLRPQVGAVSLVVAVLGLVFLRLLRKADPSATLAPKTG